MDTDNNFDSDTSESWSLIDLNCDQSPDINLMDEIGAEALEARLEEVENDEKCSALSGDQEENTSSENIIIGNDGIIASGNGYLKNRPHFQVLYDGPMFEDESDGELYSPGGYGNTYLGGGENMDPETKDVDDDTDGISVISESEFNEGKVNAYESDEIWDEKPSDSDANESPKSRRKGKALKGSSQDNSADNVNSGMAPEESCCSEGTDVGRNENGMERKQPVSRHVYRVYRNNRPGFVLRLTMAIILSGISYIILGYFCGEEESLRTANNMAQTVKKLQKENLILHSRLTQLNRAVLARGVSKLDLKEETEPPCLKDGFDCRKINLKGYKRNMDEGNYDISHPRNKNSLDFSIPLNHPKNVLAFKQILAGNEVVLARKTDETFEPFNFSKYVEALVSGQYTVRTPSAPMGIDGKGTKPMELGNEKSSEPKDKEPGNEKSSESKDKEPGNVKSSEPKDEEPGNVKSSEPKDKEPGNEKSSEPKDEEPGNEKSSESKDEEPGNVKSSEPKDEEPGNVKSSEPKDEEPGNVKSSEPKDEEPGNEKSSETKDEEPGNEKSSEPKDEEPGQKLEEPKDTNCQTGDSTPQNDETRKDNCLAIQEKDLSQFRWFILKDKPKCSGIKVEDLEELESECLYRIPMEKIYRKTNTDEFQDSDAAAAKTDFLKGKDDELKFIPSKRVAALRFNSKSTHDRDNLKEKKPSEKDSQFKKMKKREINLSTGRRYFHYSNTSPKKKGKDEKEKVDAGYVDKYLKYFEKVEQEITENNGRMKECVMGKDGRCELKFKEPDENNQAQNENYKKNVEKRSKPDGERKNTRKDQPQKGKKDKADLRSKKWKTCNIKPDLKCGNDSNCDDCSCKSGDWFSKYSEGREKCRRDQKISDWQFDRAKSREYSRMGDAFWQFSRAYGRQSRRMYPYSRKKKAKHFPGKGPGSKPDSMI